VQGVVGRALVELLEEAGVTNDSSTAPMTTPQMLPSPPRITIESTKIETPNWNWLASRC